MRITRSTITRSVLLVVFLLIIVSNVFGATVKRNIAAEVRNSQEIEVQLEIMNLVPGEVFALEEKNTSWI